MDILDILLDILLKPPQPFIGLFLITFKSSKNIFLDTCHGTFQEENIYMSDIAAYFKPILS